MMTQVGEGGSNQSPVVYIYILVLTMKTMVLFALRSSRMYSICCITDNPDLEGGIREFPVSFSRGLYEKQTT